MLVFVGLGLLPVSSRCDKHVSACLLLAAVQCGAIRVASRLALSLPPGVVPLPVALVTWSPR